MRSRTKHDVALKYADKMGIKVSDAKESIDQLLEIMKEEIREGNKLSIRGFGVFQVKKSTVKKVRDWSTGQHVLANLNPKVHFKSAIQLNKI